MGGFLVERNRLPDEAESQDYVALLQDICQRCSYVETISMDQALRLSLGLNFEATAIVQKWHEVCAWRAKYEIDAKRAHYARLQLPSSIQTVEFPHQEEIYSKAFSVSPCALVSHAGEPISIWFVG